MFHRGEFILCDKVMIGRSAVDVNCQNVGPCEEVVKRNGFGAGAIILRDVEEVMIDGGHSEGVSDFGDTFSDAAESEDAERELVWFTLGDVGVSECLPVVERA